MQTRIGPVIGLGLSLVWLGNLAVADCEEGQLPTGGFLFRATASILDHFGNQICVDVKDLATSGEVTAQCQLPGGQRARATIRLILSGNSGTLSANAVAEGGFSFGPRAMANIQAVSAPVPIDSGNMYSVVDGKFHPDPGLTSCSASSNVEIGPWSANCYLNYVSPSPSPVSGSPVRWKDPVNGSWNDETKWDPQEVPGTGDSCNTAVIDQPGAYSIDLSGAQTNRLLVRNGEVMVEGNANFVTPTFVPPGLGVGNGATLQSITCNLRARNVTIGDTAGALAKIRLASLLTKLEALNSVRVGDLGVGELEVNGGDLDCVNLDIGTTQAASGPSRVFLREASSDNSADRVRVGMGDPGEIHVEQGAQLTSNEGVLGEASLGTATVKGADGTEVSKWSLFNLTVGNAELGELKVLENALVESANTLTIGPGTVRIDGGIDEATRSTVRAGKVIVGRSEGSGELIVTNGAALTSIPPTAFNFVDLTIGKNSVGVVRVQGASSVPSQIVSAGSIDLGEAGNGTLEIAHGGRVKAIDVDLGLPGGRGELTLFDIGRQDANSKTMEIDELNLAGGEVFILDGALLEADTFRMPTQLVDIPRSPVLQVFGTSSSGLPSTLRVMGEGTISAPGSRFYVSTLGKAEFHHGLSVMSEGLTVLEINGPDAQLLVDEFLLLIPNSPTGQATLTVANGGSMTKVSSGLSVTAGVPSGGVGFIDIGNSAAGVPNATMDVDSLDLAHGLVVVRSTGELMAGEVTVGLQDFGQLSLFDDTPANPRLMCRSLTIGPSGILQMCPTAHVQAQDRIEFLLFSRFIGGGILSAPLVILAGQVVLPVNIIGTDCAPAPVSGASASAGGTTSVLSIQGNYEMRDTGVLVIEAVGENSGDFALLDVTGTATLAGRLEVHFRGGFAPADPQAFIHSDDFVDAADGVSGDYTKRIYAFPDLFADFDDDGDKDLSDVAGFQNCFGRANDPLPANCTLADWESNGVIDEVDLKELSSRLSGPN